MPDVSVLLPTFNRPHWVGGSMDSVLSQDCDLELLVLDHGSGPKTAAVLDTYTDPRIRRFRVDVNGSIGSPYTYLAREAKAPLCVYWTDDDLMLPDTLARKVAIMQANPSLGFVFSPGREMDVNGVQNPEKRIGLLLEEDRLSWAMSFLDLLKGNLVPMMSAVWRTEFIRFAEDGPKEITHSPLGDWAFWLEVLNTTGNCACLAEDTVLIRTHTGSDSHQRGMVKGEFLTSMLRIWDYWLRRGVQLDEAAWERMLQGFISIALCTPGSTQAFCLEQGQRFLDFQKKWSVSHV